MTPGQAEHAQDEMRLADQALRSASRLVDYGALEDASSRLYYAVFHAARACTTLKRLHSKTHSGLIDLYQQAYGSSPILGKLFDARGKADYEPEKYNTTAAEISHQIDEASAFIECCRSIVDEAIAGGPDEPDPPPDL